MGRLVSMALGLYRQRISVQLIVSSVLVVLLTTALIELAILAFAYVVLRTDQVDGIDETMGIQAQLAAVTLASSPEMERVATGNATANDHGALSFKLFEWVQNGVALSPEGLPTRLGDDPRAALIDPEGRVIATTNARWAMPQTNFNEIGFIPAQIVAERALELRGSPTAWNKTYVLDFAGDTLAAAHPVITEEGFAGVLIFQAEGDYMFRRSVPRYADLVFLAAANVAVLTLMVAPAVVVAIPIGIYRARKISKRLERLSDAALAMARGDLGQRVAITGEDEVARVGQRFNEMVEQLEQADRSRRAFVSNVSHELRTPVAILQGNLERMRADAERPDGSPPDPATLEAMHQETVTLARLIDDLFTLARIEEAVFEFEAGPVDVNSCIRHAVEGISRLAWEQGRVSVQSVAPVDLPLALAERARVQQILGNLLHNALRHTPEGGLIVVDAEPADDVIWVSVSDTGLGIAPEDLAHVFDRYYQGERSGRHAGGSGLGLAVVKQLIEAMSGTITVDSTPDEGTTFRFSLPRYHENR